MNTTFETMTGAEMNVLGSTISGLSSENISKDRAEVYTLARYITDIEAGYNVASALIANCEITVGNCEENILICSPRASMDVLSCLVIDRVFSNLFVNLTGRTYRVLSDVMLGASYEDNYAGYADVVIIGCAACHNASADQQLSQVRLLGLARDICGDLRFCVIDTNQDANEVIHAEHIAVRINDEEFDTTGYSNMLPMVSSELYAELQDLVR